MLVRVTVCLSGRKLCEQLTGLIGHVDAVTDGAIAEMIEQVEGDAARDLLQQLLRLGPTTRPSARMALRHTFFQPMQTAHSDIFGEVRQPPWSGMRLMLSVLTDQDSALQNLGRWRADSAIESNVDSPNQDLRGVLQDPERYALSVSPQRGKNCLHRYGLLSSGRTDLRPSRHRRMPNPRCRGRRTRSTSSHSRDQRRPSKTAEQRKRVPGYAGHRKNGDGT